MRRPLLSVIAIALATAGAAGCMANEDRPVTTAKQASGASDDRAVQINGTIVRQRSGDHYIVNDGTSDILVEIKDHVRLGKRLEQMRQQHQRGGDRKQRAVAPQRLKPTG